MPRVSREVFSIPLTTLLASGDLEVSALMGAFASSLSREFRKVFKGNETPTQAQIDRIEALASSLVIDIFGKNAEHVEKLFEVRGTLANVVKRTVVNAAYSGAQPIVSRFDRERAVLGLNPAQRSIVKGIADPLKVASSREWIDPNGLKLSSRIWRGGEETMRQINAIMQYEFSRGVSPTRLADSLEKFLTAEGAKSRTRKIGGRENRVGSYSARRLVRTEISRAHGNAVMAAAHADPFTRGVRWSLGFTHPGLDACDGNASANSYGFGPGIYPTDRVPTYPNHPHCMCYLASVDVQNMDRVRYNLRNGLIDITGIDQADIVDQVTGFAAT